MTTAKRVGSTLKVITTLSTLNESDIPALLDLAKEIGWGYNGENWRQFLRLGTVLGHRDSDGRPISSAVMIKYDDTLRWLTSFIVSPRFQRQGLARELWQGLRASDGPSNAPIGLVSTNEGLPFYESIGFKEISCVHKYVRTNGLDLNTSGRGGCAIRTASRVDMPFLEALDEAARGVRRHEMLNGKLQVAKRALVACDQDSHPNGFAMAVMEGDLLCIGPVVAPDEKTAADLIIEAAKDHPGSIRLDLLPEKLDLMQILADQAFRLERVAPVLSNGGRALPPTSHQYMALAAQALG